MDQPTISPENTSHNHGRVLLKRYLSFFVIIILLVGSFYLGFYRGENQVNDEKNVPLPNALIENKLPNANNSVDFSLFWKVWDLLKEKHVNKSAINAQELVYGAIRGMLAATGDPYTSFFDPKESQSFNQDIEGSFEGIGAELGMKDNILTVIAPLDDSPAQKAGLLAGDKIIKIGDKVTSDLSIDQAVDLIRGKKGTQITMTILHPGAEETQEVTVTRDKIEIKSVKVDFKDDNIAYLRITKFSENVDKDFSDAVNQILAHKSRGIIIDLRNNPGGLLDKTVNIASLMMPKGKVVVTEEDSAGKKDSLYTTGGDKLSQIPTVILINEGSASASEILSGALHDDQGITLIGKKSFGKGSVQQLMPLPGGASVKITVAKWLTPNGDYIMEKGINPDIEVNMTLDDFKNNRDPQLDKALEVIKEKMQ